MHKPHRNLYFTLWRLCYHTAIYSPTSFQPSPSNSDETIHLSMPEHCSLGPGFHSWWNHSLCAWNVSAKFLHSHKKDVEKGLQKPCHLFPLWAALEWFKNQENDWSLHKHTHTYNKKGSWPHTFPWAPTSFPLHRIRSELYTESSPSLTQYFKQQKGWIRAVSRITAQSSTGNVDWASSTAKCCDRWFLSLLFLNTWCLPLLLYHFTGFLWLLNSKIPGDI